jgi:hypothetical protein
MNRTDRLLAMAFALQRKVKCGSVSYLVVLGVKAIF